MSSFEDNEESSFSINVISNVQEASGTEERAEDSEQNSSLAQFLIDLDAAMIKYITQSSRLLFVDLPETWEEFHTNNASNLERFADLTPYELSVEFVSEVLPLIFDYNLSDDEFQALRLLEIHPEYRQVANGFERLPKSEWITASREPRLNVDYRIVEEPFNPPASPRKISTSLKRHTPDENLHTVVTAHKRQKQHGGYAYNFSEETHAFLSAALSNDFELSGCVLHEPVELHQRLRMAKQNFEQTAKLPKNCDSAEQLMTKIQKLSELRRTVAQMIDRVFL